jgi:hypothetical protein
MPDFFRYAVTAAVIATSAMLAHSAVGAPDMPAVKLDAFDEDYLKTVPTGGGGILVGATVGEDDAANLLKPALVVPATEVLKVSTLCVETISVDGSYWSHGQLTGTDLTANQGTLRVLPNSAKTKDPRGTQWPGEIRDFGPDNVAVLAGLGACGSQDNRNAHLFFAIDRSKGPGRSPVYARYHLAVNPRLADEVHVKYTRLDGSETQIACRAADKKFHNIAFSMICDLEGPFADETSIDLLPSLHGHPLATYSFRLVYAHAR